MTTSDARWIWRCHIDLSTPNEEVLGFLLPSLSRYDATVFHRREYVPQAHDLPLGAIWPPAIDPLAPKNMALSPEDASYIVDQFGIDVARPLITQVSRFDPWKDPLGVIDAYRVVKEQHPEVQLALVGSMAHDDPEGWDFYNQTVTYAGGDPDVYILSNLNNIGAVEVNAFQVHSAAVLQKSIREGFGLTVSEALWKARPIVAGRVGGIVDQIEEGVTGWLVDSSTECAEACIVHPHRPRCCPPSAPSAARSTSAETSSRRGCCETGSCSSTGCSATTPPGPRSRRSRLRLMADRRKLIVASNRAPVSYRVDEGRRVGPARGRRARHRATQPRLAARRDLDRERDDRGGPARRRRGRRRAFDETAHDGSSYRLRFVVSDPAAYDWYYNVVSNPTLWFIQHYLWDLAYEPAFDQGLHHAWEEGYVRVNRQFAEATLAELEREPEATVFLHDYHLYLVPYFVRREAPDALLAHFVHIPWPQQDMWRVLPEPIRRAVHEGLLGNDIVSFHAGAGRGTSCAPVRTSWASRSTRRPRLARLRRPAHPRAQPPISIDPAEFDELAASEPVRAAEEELLGRRPEKLILRVDRTDLSKNIVRGFRAFEATWHAHPEMHGRVTMLAMLDPSRQDIPDYAEYLAALQRAARR